MFVCVYQGVYTMPHLLIQKALVSGVCTRLMYLCTQTQGVMFTHNKGDNPLVSYVYQDLLYHCICILYSYSLHLQYFIYISLCIPSRVYCALPLPHIGIGIHE